MAYQITDSLFDSRRQAIRAHVTDWLTASANNGRLEVVLPEIADQSAEQLAAECLASGWCQGVLVDTDTREVEEIDAADIVEAIEAIRAEAAEDDGGDDPDDDESSPVAGPAYPADVAAEVSTRRPDLAADDAIAVVLGVDPTLTADEVIEELDRAAKEWAAEVSR